MKERQRYASLFGPKCESGPLAQQWCMDLAGGKITSFIPTHGRVAGYHIQPEAQHVPVQTFKPPIKEGTEVTVTTVNWAEGNFSVARDEDGTLWFYPHVNVDVEYEVA